MSRSCQRWTSMEIELLRDLYPDVPTADVAALLACSARRIYNLAHILGLKKSDAFNAADFSGRIQRGRADPRMVATQFKPGFTPWNKGTHFKAGGRSAETRFKKGQLNGKAAQHVAALGSYRITDSHGSPALERKMSETPGPNHLRWVPVSRLVWEAAHGPVPAGHIVVFRTPALRTTVLEEITLDKLECITRAEHARRNHPRSKSPELDKLVQLKGAITRQVNRISREADERRAA